MPPLTDNILTHLSILVDSSKRYPDLPAFKLPSPESTSSGTPRYEEITFKQFHDDVELCARYWVREVNIKAKIPPKSVIGLWYVALMTLLTPGS